MPAPAATEPTHEYAEDLALARRIRDGDEAAFVELVGAVAALLRKLSRAIVPSAAVADEVVQETWLAVLEGLDGYEGRAPLRSWVTRILVNRAKTRAVREARSVPLSSFDDEDAPAVDPSRFTKRGHWKDPPRRWDSDTPERLVAAAETRALVEKAVESLPPSQRAVFTLRDLGGWDSDEVCAALDVSEGNQRVLLHRARARVRAAIERHIDGRDV